MTSKPKLRIENIDDSAEKLTQAIIKHFTSTIAGHGYFYKDQDWAIRKIVKAHLQSLPITDKPEKQLVVLINGSSKAAKPGATGVMSTPASVKDAERWVYITWDKDNPYHCNQIDGNYHREDFKIIDNTTLSKLREAYNAVTEIIKNVT